MRKINPADFPILQLSLSSRTVNPTIVNEYAETVIAPQISTVQGVSQVMIFGNSKFAVRVQLDPNKLVNRQISLDEVQTAVDRHNANLPTGTLWGANQAFTVAANGQLNNAEEYRPLIVTYRNGSPVRLSDIGEGIDNVENVRLAGWVDGKAAVILDIQRQPGANIIETADRVKALLPRLRKSEPGF